MNSRSIPMTTLVVLAVVHWLSIPGNAAVVQASDDGSVVVDGNAFGSWTEYVTSDFFRENGMRCATPDKELRDILNSPEGAAPADCSSSLTNPTSDYIPDLIYVIPVVVHVITNAAGTQGNLSDEMIESQIAILNEDFRTVQMTNGALGTDIGLHFVLDSITRSANDTWFDDGGGYWNSLAVDPNTHLNIYTNSASGALGYVPFLPADGGGTNVGQLFDRVVILWTAFGREAPAEPYDQGRTATHEVGHYLGLEHPFSGSGCSDSASEPGCFSDGDLICDTPLDDNPHFGCPADGIPDTTTCGSPDPIHNYMEYTDDLCMTEFTVQQTRRIRCTLQFYRADLVQGMFVEFHDQEHGTTYVWDDTID